MQATNTQPSAAAAAAAAIEQGAAAGRKRKDNSNTMGSGKRPIHYPFWFGGSASSMAACVTHPLDLGKLLSCSRYTIISVLIDSTVKVRKQRCDIGVSPPAD
jgi:hypothetical protein